MDINSINIEKKLKGGSNCVVYKGWYSSQNTKKEVVIKVLETSVGTKSSLGIIKDNYLNIREKAKQKGVDVPVLYDCSILKSNEIPISLSCGRSWSFIITESYVGISIRDLLRTEVYPVSKTQSIFLKCKDFIDKLPEDIPLDTNPGNILWSETNNKLKFVDFLPPDPWLYAKNLILRMEMEKIFPTLKITLDDATSKNRYYKNTYRWQKFKYYIENYNITYDLGVLP